MTLETSASAAIPPKTVGIIAKTRLEAAATVVTEVTDWLEARGVEVFVESDVAQQADRKPRRTCSRAELPGVSNLLLVLGGDGTLLGAANAVAQAGVDVPILAVNFGSLGFLTEITLPELYVSLESVLSGTASTDARQMMQSQVVRGEEVITERIVLNDVVLGKAALSNIIEFAITLGDQLVMSCRADGLIVASPTGSTAYNLAAGGPIVHPQVDALLLTPIAPHMLTNRPIVIPTTSQVQVTPTLDGSHYAAFISFDGQYGYELAPGDRVTIERAERPLRVVRAESRSYFAVLRQKLKWSER